MAFYRVCSSCGATLDPGERCDCQDKKEAAPVLEHRDGRVEQKSDELQCSTSSLHNDKEESQV